MPSLCLLNPIVSDERSVGVPCEGHHCSTAASKIVSLSLTFSRDLVRYGVCVSELGGSGVLGQAGLSGTCGGDL